TMTTDFSEVFTVEDRLSVSLRTTADQIPSEEPSGGFALIPSGLFGVVCRVVQKPLQYVGLGCRLGGNLVRGHPLKDALDWNFHQLASFGHRYTRGDDDLIGHVAW